MITFETLDLETCELAWALWSAGDAETLDQAAALATDLQGMIGDYAVEWDLDSLEWQIAAAFAAA
jgi:hypothetical protein